MQPINSQTQLLKHACALLGFALMTTPGLGVEPPGIITYQGRVNVDGSPFSGTGFCKFALVDSAGTTTLWSNDGTSVNGAEPTAAVSLALSDGLFTVALGDTSIPNITTPIPASVFADNAGVRLRIWFDDGVNGSEQLAPDQRVTAAAYALHALGAETVADGSITEADVAPGGIHSLDAADGSPTDVVFVDNKGGVGVGTTSPEDEARLTLNANGRAQAIHASSGAASKPTIYGFNGNALGMVLHADGFADVDVTGGGIIVVGREDDSNLAIDQNEIMARSNGMPSDLFLNLQGGNTEVGGRLGVGVNPGFAQLRVQDTDPGVAFGLQVETSQQSDFPAIYANNQAGGPALWAETTSDVKLSGGGAIVVGPENGLNLAIDQNEIMVRYNGQPSALHLNLEGGQIFMGENDIKPAFAYGVISGAGTILSSSVNVTSASKSGEGLFNIQLTEAVADTDVITVTCRGLYYGSYTVGGGGVLQVSVVNTDGDLKDSQFSFLIYRP